MTCRWELGSGISTGPTSTDSGRSRFATIIAVVAFVVRLVPVLRGGDSSGWGTMTTALYYAAATGIIHGGCRGSPHGNVGGS